MTAAIGRGRVQRQARRGRTSQGRRGREATASFCKAKAGYWTRLLEPRQRALTYVKTQRLLAELTAYRAARVAFIIATSANRNETERARRADVARDFSSVLIRSTERATRHRELPIVSRAQRALLEHAMKVRQGPGDPLFTPWQNVRAICTGPASTPASRL